MAAEDSEKNIRSVGDFAKHLGLSRWTVSRILNGHEGVHESTRKRVMEEMQRIGFQPNMMARSLKGAKTGLVGVCFQEIQSPILARKISLLQDSLHARGLRAVLEITSGVPGAEREIVQHFCSLRVDGIILVGSMLEPSDPIFERLAAQAMPMVALDSAMDLPVPSVVLDRHESSRLALQHLYAHGHRRFAVLGHASDPVYGARRIEGLREAAPEFDLDWDRDFVSLKRQARRDWSYRYGYDLGQMLLELPALPSGLLALNDRVAVGVLKMLREHGLEAPRDFSIVGFDNIEIAEWSEPSLTTIGQNVGELIEQSVKLIGRVIAKELPEASPASPSRVTHVDPRLVARASTGPAP